MIAADELLKHATKLVIPVSQDTVEIVRDAGSHRWTARFLDTEAIDYSEGRYTTFPHLRKDGNWIYDSEVPKGDEYVKSFHFDSLTELVTAAKLPAHDLLNRVTRFSFPRANGSIMVYGNAKEGWGAVFLDAREKGPIIMNPPRLLHNAQWTLAGIEPGPQTWTYDESRFPSLEDVLRVAGL